MLSDSVPHSHFPCVTRGHQLVTDEEESVYRDTEAEHSFNDNKNEEVNQSSSELIKSQIKGILKVTNLNLLSFLQVAWQTLWGPEMRNS